MRWLRWCLPAGLLAAFYVLSGIYLCETTLHLQRKHWDPSTVERIQEIANVSDVHVKAPDGISLSGWLLTPQNDNGDVVLLLHGQSDNRVGMLDQARLYLDHHYTVLIPDSRGHGKSEGDLVTCGLRESGDVHSWMDWIQSTEKPHCVYGFGASMGAAILLQSLKGETRFCAVVAECSFASFREIAYDRMGQMSGLGRTAGTTILRPIVESAFLWGRWKYGVRMELVSPPNSVEGLAVPILLIHGTADKNIPPRHSQIIQSRNPAIQLWLVPGAGHVGAFGRAPAEFERRVIGFFQAHTTKSQRTRSPS